VTRLARLLPYLILLGILSLWISAAMMASAKGW
jgi:hypothetical protein